MAKKKKPSKKTVLVKIHLQPALHQRLRAHAAAGGMFVSDAVNELIETHVPNYQRIFENMGEIEKLENELKRKNH